MEEKKLDTAENACTEAVAPARLEEQLSALVRQLTFRLEENEQAEAARREMLDSREEELNRREMNACLREALEKRGLPVLLAEGLFFSDAEAMTAGVDALEESFRTAVQQGVEARLLHDVPKAAPIRPLSEMTDEDYYAVVYRHEV